MIRRFDSLLEKIQQMKAENKALKEEINELKKSDKPLTTKAHKKEKKSHSPSLF